MPTAELGIETQPTAEQIQYLEDRLYEFNVQATGINDGDYLAIFERDANGRITAGLCGTTWGGCLEIRQLWVDAPLRGAGMGSRMLAAAEAEARLRGCEQILLSTFSFQAPDFYARFGFEVQSVVTDYPRGHRSLQLLKRLTR